MDILNNGYTHTTHAGLFETCPVLTDIHTPHTQDYSRHGGRLHQFKVGD